MTSSDKFLHDNHSKWAPRRLNPLCIEQQLLLQGIKLIIITTDCQSMYYHGYWQRKNNTQIPNSAE